MSEAPDKIYAIDIGEQLLIRRTPSTTFGKEWSEYIRKDLLLEWAKEFEVTYLSGNTVIKFLIEKLQSL